MFIFPTAATLPSLNTSTAAVPVPLPMIWSAMFTLTSPVRSIIGAMSVVVCGASRMLSVWLLLSNLLPLSTTAKK